MNRPFRSLFHIACLGVLALSVAVPAWAGIVYVPLTGDVDIEGIGFRTDLRLTNTTNQPIEVETRFIGENSDGAENREATPQRVTIAPHGTFMIQGASQTGAVGALEVDLPAGAVATARLVPIHGVFGEGLGAEIPLVTTRNLFEEGQTAHVLGWERTDGERITNFGLVNLGADVAQCEVNVYRGNGKQIASTALLTVFPLSNRHFPDALGILGQSDTETARTEVTCDQDFYAYSTLMNLETAEVTFMPPSAAGADGLIDPTADCPPEGYCVERQGRVFVPSRQDPVGDVDLQVPRGTYSRVEMTLEVTVGNWFPQNPDGRHNIFWLVRDNNKDMFGFLNVNGPNANSILLRHGFGQRHIHKAKLRRGLQLTPGRTYEFTYIYDTDERVVDTIVRNSNGDVLQRMTGVPDISRININSGNDVILTFGFKEHLNPQELPTYGWVYQNLRIAFTK